MWNLNPSATSATPISTRNASASILVVGCSATNRATGPDDTYMMRQAMMTAAIMMGGSCALPMAVIIETNENTISMTMIWIITQKNAVAFGPSSFASSCASTSVWISWVAF